MLFCYFEKLFGKLRLTGDRLRCAYLYFSMVRYRNSDGLIIAFLMHDDMTTFLADLFKSVFIKDFADIFS